MARSGRCGPTFATKIGTVHEHVLRCVLVIATALATIRRRLPPGDEVLVAVVTAVSREHLRRPDGETSLDAIDTVREDQADRLDGPLPVKGLRQTM